MDSDFITISIGWTSDLAHYEGHLRRAIDDCAIALPACHYRIHGTNNVANSHYTADDILKNCAEMSCHVGLIIDPHKATKKLDEILNRQDANTDFIILLTRQNIICREPQDNYKHHASHAAIITLKNCETGSDIRNISAILLEHIMRHFFMQQNIYRHCSRRDCIMTPMEEYRNIQRLASYEQQFDAGAYCRECKVALHKSPYWKDEYLSIIKYF